VGKKYRISAEPEGLYVESGNVRGAGSLTSLHFSGIGGDPTHAQLEADGQIGVNVSSTEGVFDVYHSANSRFIIKETGDIEVIGDIYNNGLQIVRECIELADDTTIALPSNTAGWGTVIAGNMYCFAHFKWDRSGNISLIESTSNVVTTDTDAYFCIYSNSGVVTIKNRLAVTMTVCFEANCSSYTASIPFVSDSDTLILWHLDETSGSVIDSGPYGINGTNTGLTPNQPGPSWMSGTSYLSDNVNDYITVASTYWGSPSTEGVRGTVEFLFKPTNMADFYPGPGLDRSFFRIDYVGTNDLSCFIREISGTNYFIFDSFGNSLQIPFNSPAADSYFSTSTWTHVKCVWDRYDFGTRLYLNNTLVDETGPFYFLYGNNNRIVYFANSAGVSSMPGYYDEFRYSKVVR